MKSKLLIVCLTVLILSGQILIAGEKQNSAVEPANRHSWWTLRNDAVNERVKQGNVDLLMIGDSITHGWEGGEKKSCDNNTSRGTPSIWASAETGRSTYCGGWNTATWKEYRPSWR